MTDVLSPEVVDAIEQSKLAAIGDVAIDDMIEYVHAIDRTPPGPLELYSRYLRQRWDVNELDFTQDAVDWNEKMTEEERGAFLSVASGFHHGERQVEVELPAFMLGIDEEDKIFITSQMEDEARHTVFFDRFYREVVGLPGETIMDVLDNSWEWVGDGFGSGFALLAYQADQLIADRYNPRLQVQFATNYFLFIEGVGALSVMKITLNYARQRGFLPAYYKGFTATCRDEARHVQFGLGFIRRKLEEDPTLVKDVHDVMRTVLYAFGTNSRAVFLEPVGFTEEKLRALFMDQLVRKLNLVGVSLPPDVEALYQAMQPQLIGG